jgi:hypothetical protein
MNVDVNYKIEIKPVELRPATPTEMSYSEMHAHDPTGERLFFIKKKISTKLQGLRGNKSESVNLN